MLTELTVEHAAHRLEFEDRHIKGKLLQKFDSSHLKEIQKQCTGCIKNRVIELWSALACSLYNHSWSALACSLYNHSWSALACSLHNQSTEIILAQSERPGF